MNGTEFIICSGKFILLGFILDDSRPDHITGLGHEGLTGY